MRNTIKTFLKVQLKLLNSAGWCACIEDARNDSIQPQIATEGALFHG